MKLTKSSKMKLEEEKDCLHKLQTDNKNDAESNCEIVK